MKPEQEFINMSLKLPYAVHEIIFLQQSKMKIEKKRNVSIKEAAIHIIKDWGKNKGQ